MQTAAPKAGRSNPAPDDLPLYKIIVKALRVEIQREFYPVGSILPSETELMRRFGVSRHTVRTAIRALQDLGLVRTHRGLGTIVNPATDRSVYVHQINTISDLFPVGVETRHDPVDHRFVPLPDAAKAFADLQVEHRWLRITGDRLDPQAHAPLNEFEVFVAARFAGVGRVIGATSPSIYAVLESIYGETISEVEQMIGGFVADGVTGARIGLSKGDPGIEVRRVHRVASDNSIGIVSFNRYPLSDYSFSMTLRRIDS